MTVVVDASVAIRWLLDLPGSELAYGLIEEQECMVAPDSVIAEIASAIWKAVFFADLAPSTAAEAIAGAETTFDELVSATGLKDRALAISLALRHPPYDCFYLALAEARECHLVTADKRLVRRCAGTPFAGLVREL